MNKNNYSNTTINKDALLFLIDYIQSSDDRTRCVLKIYFRSAIQNCLKYAEIIKNIDKTDEKLLGIIIDPSDLSRHALFENALSAILSLVLLPSLIHTDPVIIGDISDKRMIPLISTELLRLCQFDEKVLSQLLLA